MRRIIAILLLVISLLTFVGCQDKTITGNEWLLKQDKCLDDLELFTQGMDEVYTLYIINAINEEDFVAELGMLNTQYDALLIFYEELKKDNPITPESHSYLSLTGTNAIETMYEEIGNLLNSTVDENNKPYSIDQVAYTYLAYRDVIAKQIALYTTAVEWYNVSLS